MPVQPLNEKQRATLEDLSKRDPATLSKAQKKELSALQEQKADFDAEQMETKGTTNEKEGGDNDVYVFANLDSGQEFKLSDGSTVRIEGVPVSSLKKPGGGFFPGGKYAVTLVNADKWAEVEKTYGSMRMFQTKLVFSAPTLEKGRAMARELGGLRHGFEQVDPENDRRSKTTPKDDKD